MYLLKPRTSQTSQNDPKQPPKNSRTIQNDPKFQNWGDLESNYSNWIFWVEKYQRSNL